MGSNEGYLFVRENLGSATEPKFSVENIQLKSGEGDEAKPLYTGDGHALPIVFDWDNDGLLDLITGSNNRGALWSRNVGKKGSPAYAPMEVLIEPGQKDAEEIPVGTRWQVAAGDFDNDGKPDLLVGDYNNLEEPDKRTDEEKEHDRKEDALKYIREFDITYPNGPDPTGEISIDYGVSGLPVTFFVSRKGEIVRRWVGAIDKSVLMSSIEEII